MKHLSILIKPASGLCNMRCGYCFYHDLLTHNREISKKIMTPKTAQTLIDRAFEEAEESISFAFQGGEPTLAGLEFFRQFVAEVEVRKEENPDISVSFSIQTNGFGVDEKWCNFFGKHRFLVGLSLDGYRELHDTNRRDIHGKPSFDRIAATYKLLCKKGVETNILCVVTGEAARQGALVYKSLKNMKCRYIQFIPCLDPIHMPRGRSSFSLQPKVYAKFLKSVFDLWYQDWCDGNYHSIRLFDDYIYLAMGITPSTCASSGMCGRYAVVESDGSVYPCDFYVTTEWRLGSILESSFGELTNGGVSEKFIRDSEERPLECNECLYNRICRGGCKRDWIYTEMGVQNYYCQTYKEILGYAQERIYKIARAEWRARGRSD